MCVYESAARTPVYVCVCRVGGGGGRGVTMCELYCLRLFEYVCV